MIFYHQFREQWGLLYREVTLGNIRSGYGFWNWDLQKMNTKYDKYYYSDIL